MSSDAFARFARRVAPVHRWSELAASDDVVAHLRRVQTELVTLVTRRGNRGGAQPRARQALVALFTGPSEDAKTVAGEAIANDLRVTGRVAPLG